VTEVPLLGRFPPPLTNDHVYGPIPPIAVRPWFPFTDICLEVNPIAGGGQLPQEVQSHQAAEGRSKIPIAKKAKEAIKYEIAFAFLMSFDMAAPFHILGIIRCQAYSLSHKNEKTFHKMAFCEKKKDLSPPKIKAWHRVCNYQAFKIPRHFSLQRSHLYVFEEELYRRRINHKGRFSIARELYRSKKSCQEFFWFFLVPVVAK